MTSPAAYRQIASKQNKFLVLPHTNTLKKYINFTKPSSGFNPEIIQKLIEDFKIVTIEDYEKNVSLTFDEIKIKSWLVYKRGSGKVVGFTEMGSINEEIKEFVDRCNKSRKFNYDSQFANYVIVFMVRVFLTNSVPHLVTLLHQVLLEISYAL